MYNVSVYTRTDINLNDYDPPYNTKVNKFNEQKRCFIRLMILIKKNIYSIVFSLIQ